MKQEIAKALQNITPQRPDSGPPLPYFMNIWCPKALSNNMPQPVRSLSRVYSNARASLIRPLYS